MEERWMIGMWIRSWPAQHDDALAKDKFSTTQNKKLRRSRIFASRPSTMGQIEMPRHPAGVRATSYAARVVSKRLNRRTVNWNNCTRSLSEVARFHARN